VGKGQSPQEQGGSRATQFKKGQSGNPGGRPKGSISLVNLIRRRLTENPELADAIADNLIALAAQGDQKAINAIREILDRVDGKVPQQVDAKVEGDIVVRCELT
jgi:hypothetical protein